MESVPVFHVCMALALIARTLPPRVRSRGLWGADVRSISEHGSLSIRGGGPLAPKTRIVIAPKLYGGSLLVGNGYGKLDGNCLDLSPPVW